MTYNCMECSDTGLVLPDGESAPVICPSCDAHEKIEEFYERIGHDPDKVYDAIDDLFMFCNPREQEAAYRETVAQLEKSSKLVEDLTKRCKEMIHSLNDALEPDGGGAMHAVKCATFQSVDKDCNCWKGKALELIKS